jgi:hypothetical protein
MSGAVQLLLLLLEQMGLQRPGVDGLSLSHCRSLLLGGVVTRLACDGSGV